MNPQTLTAAIKLRLLDDDAIGGYTELVTGTWWNQAPPGTTTYPYVLIDTVDAGNEDGFAFELTKWMVRISILHKVEAQALAIIGRIEGNWLTSTGRVPTYGLNRHVLTLSDGYSASGLRRTNTSMLSVDAKITRQIIEYEVYTSKLATSP